jgi:Asp-tRNA(Asn)/Glu-tRNA(Gln) amidotransferase A subunit family amidase
MVHERKLRETFMRDSNEMQTTRRGAFGLMAGAGTTLLGACARGAEPLVEAAISPEDVAAAEKLMGVSYSDLEREQLLSGLDGSLAQLEALRAHSKPNQLAPSSVFDPRIPGQNYEIKEGGTRGLPSDAGTLPSDAVDIAFASIWKQAQWMNAGLISSLELTNIYLDRIGRYDPQLNAFITVLAAQARQSAEERDRERSSGRVRGPLHGIPYALKDIIDVADVRATWGAEIYKDRVADQTATVALKLENAGAVLLGKTSVGALAYGDIWFGAVTRNPFDPLEGSSGSSAGSASATAAGLCGFAIGTETLGSIVSPSHRCGTTGLRPSFGRVSRHNAMALCWSLDKIGPIVRNVLDASLVMDAINGIDVADASSLETSFGADFAIDLEGLRLGYDPEAFEAGTHTDREALDVARSLGVKLVQKRPDIASAPYGSLTSILVAEAAAAFGHITLENTDDQLRWQSDNAWPNTFRQARFMSAVDAMNADRIRRQAMTMMHDMFSDIDAYIGPNFANSMLTLTNFTGQPQLFSVPALLIAQQRQCLMDPPSLVKKRRHIHMEQAYGRPCLKRIRFYLWATE